MTRDSWSLDGQYFLRATVNFLPDINLREVDVINGSVRVYLGDLEIAGSMAIFMSETQSHSDDLYGQLDVAEQLGRDYINSIQQP